LDCSGSFVGSFKIGWCFGGFFFGGPCSSSALNFFCALWCLDVFLKLPFREACASPHALHATRASKEAVNCGESREEEEEEEEEKEKNLLV
jgi:hypothetical protein